MNRCKNCKDFIPWSTTISGTKRSLTKRKYCLLCSPFGEHNTRDVNRKRKGDKLKCSTCKRDYIYDKRKGNSYASCGSCFQAFKRKKIKAKAISYKGGKCQNCGYSKCTRALGFHHRNPKTKEFTISTFPTISWERLKKELDKCDILCANCHMEEENRIQASNSTVESPPD